MGKSARLPPPAAVLLGPAPPGRQPAQPCPVVNSPVTSPSVTSPVPFAQFIALFDHCIARRSVVVAAIENLLSAQKLPPDPAWLDQQFKACFFEAGAAGERQRQLVLALEQAHWDSGFRPRAKPGNELLEASTLLLRGLHCWRQTRWPGHKGRLRYAHALFCVHVLRGLALLSLRLWDDGDAPAAVAARLQQLQTLLTALWADSPAGLPALVRDARWLLPLAQSPTTDELGGYFDVAERCASSFTREDLLETARASVVTGGGHLRSQLRHLCVLRGVSLDDPSLALITRVSNALDVAQLMEGLVPLLAAYGEAVTAGAAAARLALASAICQGLSPDPALYVNRLDLLGPYTMIEHVFVTTAAESCHYSARGQRHLRLLDDYRRLIVQHAPALLEDCRQQTLPAGTYSPYGALYGFASNLPELLAFKTLQAEAESQYGMEDVFTAGDARKRAWVNGWRDLPHVPVQVVQQFAYPEDFANAVARRIEQALAVRVRGSASPQAGTLYVSAAANDPWPDIATLARDYVVASDPRWVDAGRAEAKPEADLLYCRLEGEFVVSFATAAGWVGLTKDLLSEVLGAGQSAKLLDLPAEVVRALPLLCPGLAVVTA